MNNQKILPKYLIIKVVTLEAFTFSYYILAKNSYKLQKEIFEFIKVSDLPLVYKDKKNFYTIKHLKEQDYIILFFYINDIEFDPSKRNEILEKYFNMIAKNVYID